MKRKYVYMYILIALLLLSGGFVISANAHASDERITVDIKHDGLIFRYIDAPIKPTNHLVALEFKERKINGTRYPRLQRVCHGST